MGSVGGGINTSHFFKTKKEIFKVQCCFSLRGSFIKDCVRGGVGGVERLFLFFVFFPDVRTTRFILFSIYVFFSKICAHKTYIHASWAGR